MEISPPPPPLFSHPPPIICLRFMTTVQSFILLLQAYLFYKCLMAFLRPYSVLICIDDFWKQGGRYIGKRSVEFAWPIFILITFSGQSHRMYCPLFLCLESFVDHAVSAHSWSPHLSWKTSRSFWVAMRQASVSLPTWMSLWMLILCSWIPTSWWQNNCPSSHPPLHEPSYKAQVGKEVIVELYFPGVLLLKRYF